METAERLKRLEKLSPAKRAILLKALSEKAAAAASRGIPKRTQSGAVPLSFAQNRLWLLDQLYPGSAAYNVPCAARLKGALNVTALNESLNEVIRRHDILRTTFNVIDEQPMQFIAPAVELRLPVIDLEGHAEREREVIRIANDEAAGPFDLAAGPLVRMLLLRLGSEEHVLLLTMHHIICDGWSDAIIINEMSAIYTALMEGKSSPLPALPIQYADYAVWQREWLTGEALKDLLSYWRTQLADAPPVLELPIDYRRPVLQNYRCARETLVLGRVTTEALGRLGRAEGVTLFMTLLAGFAALLSRHTGQEDIVIGAPIAGRPRVETEGLIGFFVNTLALRVDLSGDPTYLELLARARNTTLAAHEHQELPFEKLVEELKPERNLSNTPLFQVVLDVQNASTEVLEVPGLSLSLLPLDVKAAKFDLLMTVVESTTGDLSTTIEYDTDLFEAKTVRRLLGHWERLLEAAAANPQLHLSELPLLTAQEEIQQREWNETEVEYEREQSINELFERQAAERGEAVAIRSGAEGVTYGELNRRANQLARYLQGLGVGPEVAVGVCAERSVELVVSLLGILKAGGAYVPLDPGYPAERLSYMLADTGVEVLLVGGSVGQPAGQWGEVKQVLGLEAALERASREAGEDLQSPAPRARAENLAYVMYTSGSTGTPKGVCITHRNVVRLVRHTDYVELGPGEVFLLLAPLTFDASTFELWGALLNGGQLVVAPPQLPTPQELAGIIKEQGVTTLWLTAGLFHLMVEEQLAGLQQVRQLLAGGDVLAPVQVRKVLAGLGAEGRLINGYGPTESTTFGCCHRMGRASEFGERVPLGRAIANTTAYVLDGQLQAVGVGVVGELYLGGDGLARGYRGAAGLTAERFVPHPYSEVGGARLYRTGDLVRRLSDGVLEFVGRGDEQVKVRGHRVELGEVEAVLGEHEGVAAAVVVARDEGLAGKRLVAYVVAVGGGQLSSGELRAYLQRRVPDYLLPSLFVPLAHLPLTANGKIDRRALPEPEITRDGLDQPFISPRTPIEEVLADIYASVLQVERVGVHDDFFELGGHSLMATQVVSRANKAFNVNIPLRDFFERSAVNELAELVEREMREETGRKLPPVVRAPREAALPLSFAQQRLWFLYQLEPNSTLYNIPLAARLKGKLDVEALERALSEITRRHEILRTTFAVVDGRPVPIVTPHTPLSLPMIDLASLHPVMREAEIKRQVNEAAQRPFNLSEDALLRIKLVRLGNDEHVVLLTIHHIVCDGWSIEILMQEVARLYGAFVAGGGSPLEDLVFQYADYAAWQRSWLHGETLEQQLSYWVRELEGAPPVMTLSTDHPRPSVQSYRGAKQTIELPSELSEAIKALGREAGVTLFMTLLAAWQVLLYRYAGQERISVGTPIAGRTSPEFEELIGLFVNTLILHTDMSGDPTFAEVLQRVRETALGAYMNQDVPFEKLVEVLQPQRTLQHAPLFQVVFMLHNTLTKRFQLEGLTLSVIEPDIRTAIVDLKLAVSEAGPGLFGELEYNADLFEAATARRLLGNWRQLLEGACANPDLRLWELPLLSTGEQEELFEWNQTETGFGVEQCLHKRFAAQAERTPESIALVHQEEQLTYDELNRRANKLARHLKGMGIGPEMVVGVLMERSVEMVVALLAILKAGAAYLPLDPEYPRERLSFMLEDSGTKVVLTQTRHREAVADVAKVVCVDGEWETIQQQNGANLASGADVENLAYVIYTSGSTGRPKGVCITHKAICNRLLWMQREFPLSAQDCLLQKTTFSFDASVWELFSPLLAGARVVLARAGGERDSVYLAQAVVEHEVTVLQLVPSMLRVWLEETEVGTCRSLRRVFSGGEALSADLAARFYERLTGAELHNLYGPTEVAIDATHEVCGRADKASSALMPIGRPLSNVEVHVLDKHLNQVPVGVVGELYVGGAGLARGYLGQAMLTAERFVPDPCGKRAGGRLYRTGDLGRRLSDGRLEYVGRSDEQVKVRGYRIELGEIEAVLNGHEGVAECAVVAREEAAGHKRLVAYVVPRQSQSRETSNGELHKLPNNLKVSYLNRNETDVIYREIFEDQTYSKYGITFNDGDCIFDVGANIGLFTLFVHEKCRAPRVYAFEPIPATFDKLRRNTELYGLDVRLFECGLSDESTEKDVTFYPHWSGMSGAYANAREDEEITRAYLNNLSRQAALPSEEISEILEDRFKSETFRCRMRTLSEVMSEQQIEQIDLLKVDVERSELDVLCGIEEKDWRKIGQIVLEVHDRDGQLQTIRNLLARHGFEVVIEQDKLLENTELYNVYAVQPARARERAARRNGQPESGWLRLRMPGVSLDDLRSSLETKLPEYMVPSAFVMLDALPRTPNGKVDRRALPAPTATEPSDEETFVAPRTEMQRKLAEIWADVLGLERVGIDSNFFSLGGDSIISLQLVARARKAGIKFTTRQLFQHQTIADLSSVTVAAIDSRVVVAASAGPTPLTPAQHSFFDHELLNPHHFNQALLFEVRRPLDEKLLGQAIACLVKHHDALRLRFTRAGAGWEAHTIEADHAPVAFERVDLSDIPEPERRQAIEGRTNSAQRSLNLSEGPLLRVVLFDLCAPDAARLLLVAHHLIVDAVSWRILLQDLEVAYEQLSRAQEVSLPPVTTSFKQWSEGLRDYANGPALRAELGYWRALSSQNVNRLPLDSDIGENRVAALRVHTAVLSEDETRALLRDVPGAYRTQINDALITALAQTLGEWSGSPRVLIDLEAHGREEVIAGADVSRTVGWFTTLYPVVLEVPEWTTPGVALKRIKEQLRRFPKNGIGYGLLRYLSSDPGTTEQLSQTPRSEVSFNYLGQFDRVLPEETAFGTASEWSGAPFGANEKRWHLLEVSGSVEGGRLKMEWGYNEEAHRPETIKKLARRYTEALRSIITHCQSPSAGGFTPSDFPLAQLDQEMLDKMYAVNPRIEDIYPLSPLQNGLLYHALRQLDLETYFQQMTCVIHADLNVEAFRRAWQSLLDRHAILRTSFAWEELNNAVQIVTRGLKLPWDQQDWRHLSVAERQEKLNAYLKADRARGFELSAAPLTRISLIQLEEQAYQFTWSLHHLLLDGWSGPVLIKELVSLYAAFQLGENSILPPARPFREYIDWLGQQDLSPAASYWRQNLSGFTIPTRLKLDRVSQGAPSGRPEHEGQRVALTQAETQDLQAFARSHQLTVNALIQGSWALVLSRHSGQRDVLFGAVVSGRPEGLAGVETMVGPFINTLPVRVKIDDEEVVLEWLRRLQANQIEMRQYEHSPLVDVQGWSDVPRGVPLFDSFLNFLNYPKLESKGEWSSALRVSNFRTSEKSSYALTVDASMGAELILEITADSRHFDAPAVMRLLEDWGEILRALVAHPQTTLRALLSEIDETERRRRDRDEEERRERHQQRLKETRRRAVTATE